MTISGNTFTGTGALFQAGGTQSFNNLTFYNNTVAGDLFSVNGGTLTLTNSTIAGNTSASAAKINVINVLSGTANLLNNILVGNNGTNGTSAVTVADGATVNAFYNVYDSADATLNSTNTVGTMADVLGTTPAFDGKTVAIAPAGAAATNGTLVGKIGSDLYYVADGSWFKVGSDTAAATFDAANTNNDNYGLGTATGTSVYTTAQNGMGRLAVADLGFFNVGAYAFDPAMVETASTVVDLAEDVVNPFDGKISLREAIAYAGTGSLGNEITFADAVTAVTLTQLLAVGKNITIMDNDVTVNGNLSVASGSTLTVSSGSKVTLGTVSNSGTVDNKGTLTLAALEGAGNLTNSGTLDVNGNFAGGTVDNTGSMTLSGTSNSGTGTLGDVTYDGTADQQIIASETYGDLVISTTGTATVDGDLKAETTTNSTTLDVNGNFAGGTVNNTGSMILAGANNSGTGTLGNVTYDGANQNIIAGTYGSLTVSSTGTATANGDLTATTTTVNSGATLDVNGNFAGGTVNNTGAMTLSGASNSGTGTLGDVTYDGADQQIIASETYGDLVISTTGKATVDGNLKAETTTNSATLDVNGNFAGGNVTNTGSMTLSGASNSATGTLGDVTYDGTTAQQVIAGTYDDLVISSTGKATATGNISATGDIMNGTETEITGDMTAGKQIVNWTNGNLSVGGSAEAQQLVNYGEMEVSGDVTISSDIVAYARLIAYGSMKVGGDVDVESVVNYDTLEIAGDLTATNDVYNDANLTVGGNFSATTTDNSGTLDVDGNFAGGAVTNTGSMTLAGAFNSGTGTLGNVTYDGADQQVIAGTYGDLTINSTGKATATGDITAATVDNYADTEVTGNLTATGDVESTAALTVGGSVEAVNVTTSGDTEITGNLTATGDLESTAAFTVGGSVEAVNVTTSGEMEVADNLTATGTVDSDAALTVGGNFSAATTDNSSDLKVSGNYTADTTTTSGTLDVNGDFAGGTVTNTGSMSLAGATNSGTGTLGDVTYDGATDQQVIAGTYEDLVISTTGKATANGDISAATVKSDAETAITGNLTATGSITSNGDMNVTGDLTATGNITSNGDMDVTGDLTATGDLTSTAALTIGGSASANNATLSGDTEITGDLTATGNITSNGDMDVTGNLTTTGDLASTAALTVGGNASANNATLSGDTAITGDLTATGDLASTAALTVGGSASANNATLSGETTVTGNLTATGTVDSDAALTVGGNLTADTADNSSALTVGGTFTANTTNNSGTLDAEGDLNAGALTNSGNISVAGAFATTSTDLGAVEYDGTAAQNVVEGTYSDLSLTGGDKALAGAVTVTDSLTADANIDTAGQDLTLSGDVAGTGTISTSVDTGTVTYDGADQNVLAGAYNNLALVNGTKTLSSANTTTVNDTFTANNTTIQSDMADVLASLTVKDAGDDNAPSSAIAGTNFNGIALNNTGSADGYLYVNADTNNADDATTGVYLVGNVFVAANGIIYGDTLGEVYITVTNSNGDVICEGTADELGWTWAMGNEAIENATTGTAYELVSKAGYKFRFHGDVDVVIGKRAITVKADDIAIDTGKDPEFTYTYVGELVGSDAFTGELASEGDGSKPGDFAITQGTLTLGDNYDITFIGGTLTVEGGGQDAHQFPNYNNPGNFAGVYDAPVHSMTHSYDHHTSVPTLEHQNDRSIGFLFSVSNKQLGDASGTFGDNAPRGADVNIHAHTLSDLLKSYDKSEQIIASPANEIEDAKDDMKDLHDFSNNPFGILPDDEDLHTRAYDESIDFTVIGEDNLSTAKAEQFKDEFDAALEEILSLA